MDAFLDADTPGNVGVALSGGGSRALSAGMGQLRALAALRNDGRSLLSQVKALCAVSGGAWLSVPYIYLRGDVSDEDFLGVMVPPEELRPYRLPGAWADAALDHLRPGNIGQVPANRDFSPGAWAFEVLGMTKRYDVPDRMLWQTLVARHVLAPYGLFEGWEAARGEPASLFSYDAATRDRDVLAENPALASTPAYLYADQLDPRRDRRPFLICQGALLLTRPGASLQVLAQVQMTPFFAGVVGRPAGVDANGQPVGGGVVTPFAYAGVVVARDGQTLTIEHARPFSLADAVGISSSIFSEAIRNSREHLRTDPSLREAMNERTGDGPNWLPDSVKAELKTKLDTAAEGWVESATTSEPMRKLSRTELLVPSYCAVGPARRPAVVRARPSPTAARWTTPASPASWPTRTSTRSSRSSTPAIRWQRPSRACSTRTASRSPTAGSLSRRRFRRCSAIRPTGRGSATACTREIRSPPTPSWRTIRSSSLSPSSSCCGRCGDRAAAARSPHPPRPG